VVKIAVTLSEFRYFVVEDLDEVLEPDELGREAEGVLHQHRLPERLARRPDEEDERHRDLRQHQQIGQQGVAEVDPLQHEVTIPRGRRCGALPRRGRAPR